MCKTVPFVSGMGFIELQKIMKKIKTDTYLGRIQINQKLCFKHPAFLLRDVTSSYIAHV